MFFSPLKGCFFGSVAFFEVAGARGGTHFFGNFPLFRGWSDPLFCLRFFSEEFQGFGGSPKDVGNFVN